jgi:predicted nucleic acid-binding protein
MTHYLDTSAFIALFDPANPHCRHVLAWREKQRIVTPSYNRMLQLESRHYLRRLAHSYAGVAWNAFRAFESAKLYEWERLDLARLFEQAEDLSQEHKPNLQCGFWDLCHIVAARKADLAFVTCDKAQSEAARLIGVKTTYVKA